jgi:YrbI family 3-deoxy-D-manno-octulosonate 8-phosphate phosphatase
MSWQLLGRFLAFLVSRKPTPVLPIPPELVVFDFDGVFTDNKVYTDQNGGEFVKCDRRDGLGIDMLRAKGIPALILSTEANTVVAARGRKLKLEVVQDCGNKAAYLSQRMSTLSVDPSRVIYVGNDVNDLKAMQLVGFPVAPADAHPAVKQMAALVLTTRGGEGAVRELCDLIIK